MLPDGVALMGRRGVRGEVKANALLWIEAEDERRTVRWRQVKRGASVEPARKA